MTTTARASLSLVEMDALLARLSADREQAGAAYERLREKLVRFFEQRDCSSAELTDEVLDRVAHRLAGGELVRDLPGYVHGVAVRVWQETWRGARFEPLQDVAAAAVDEAEQGERLDACLQHCLGRLDADERVLVLRYHRGSGRERIADRAELAAQLGMSPNALRIRVHRLQAGLRPCLTRCLAAALAEGAGGPR